MSGRSCAGCRHAFSEPWTHGKKALRCGCRANGPWYGRVVNFYPAEDITPIGNYPAPAWCRLDEIERTEETA